ncbi:MAG: sphingomyelin phosphodiesterase [Cyclobacteriaceae bacterium]|nr:sphingomyelin phosphodiesterase [Cyclobacteriaceae bacterium]
MRWLLFLVWLCSLAGYSPATAQDSLRVLSWNVQMLPSFIKSNGKKKRSKAIVNQLKQHSFDVIVFQEMFHRRSRNIISKGLRELYPYQTKVLNHKWLAFKTNGGVMIFSRHPITAMKQIRYKSREGIDRMSRKGALLAELSVNGKPLQVAGTHLQAFGSQPVMYAQYQQLHDELLKPNQSNGVPQLVCGDFNTLKSLPPKLPEDISQEMVNRLARYPVMLETLKATDGELEGNQQFTMDRPFNDLCKTRKEFRLLIDYVLLRPNGLEKYSVKRNVKIMRQAWHPDHQDLSDHFGLEAVFTGWNTSQASGN